MGVDPERLQIGGSGLADGLGDLLAVLADVLTAATHPDAEVARERERLVERISVARAQPRTIAREALQRRRFGDHPITREMPTGDEVAAVTAEQVRALHASSLVPARLDPHPRRRHRPGGGDHGGRAGTGRLDVGNDRARARTSPAAAAR